jgi:F-type H+-transporting ATPase subunit gamma
MRLKSVKNIQKITKSMKMVSAAKFAKAEKDLKIARPYGVALSEFDSKVEITSQDPKEAQVVPANVKKHLIIAVSSDRGLCGAIHTSIVKAVKALLVEKKAAAAGLETKIVPVGDKAKQILQRTHASQILFSVNDVGKKTIVFLDAAAVANEVLKSGFEFDSGELLYNRFK